MKFTYDIQNSTKTIKSCYSKLIKRGVSQRLAEMLALRKAPRCMTDDVFYGGQTLAQQFGNNASGLEQVTKAAKKHGYVPNSNDRYESGLCRPEVGMGDPQAFVPASGGRGYVKRLLENRGWEGLSDGAVTVKYREPEKDPRKTAAEIQAMSQRKKLKKKKKVK